MLFAGICKNGFSRSRGSEVHKFKITGESKETSSNESWQEFRNETWIERIYKAYHPLTKENTVLYLLHYRTLTRK